ncbi:MAG: pyruvate dehydrogenase (acetyl-transferring) E1 component subunit alpha [Candidatus Rokubacteria bacterium RIFCSPLOWO2_12_FULL_69_21]|nr:MAG: pyruvate dehydrogenase (acetyl-transferring) E1 component subunit alpha [Candidatus Rokubacteria bacterium RIFCSPLOWO2_12_FULL_69_21]
MTPGPDQLLEMYAAMLRVRLFEERARELYAGGRIPGFIHLSVGQEAVAVGVCAALRRDDYLLSTHRGHGHLIAKGGSLRGLMAELYGKATGCCKGKGGSMHIADASVGYLGANGVLAAGCVLAPGVGLSIQMRKTDQVVVAIFGDGAANRGPFHEGVNLAALWRAPAVFVCENNRWASTTAQAVSTAGGSIAQRAAGYGIPGVTVDGNEVLAVFEAVGEAVARARRGEGPSLVEAQTIRWLGHYEGDPQLYRGKDEVAEGRSRDPVGRLRQVLEERNLLDAAHAVRIEAAVKGEIDDAVAFAEASPLPDARAAFEDLFAFYPWRD